MVRRRYPHQVEGIQWLWRMHHGPYGGALLADDMGSWKDGPDLGVSAVFV